MADVWCEAGWSLSVPENLATSQYARAILPKILLNPRAVEQTACVAGMGFYSSI
jgi:hypothetical protein